MQRTFRIERKYKKAVFKSWLLHATIVLGAYVVVGYFAHLKFSFEPILAGITMTVLLIYFLPGVMLYFKYLNRNRETQVVIDLEREELHVKDQGRDVLVKFSQIYTVQRVWIAGDEITSFRSLRFPFKWEVFGYLRIVISGQPDLILTSLMIDINCPPISPDCEIYRIFPFSLNTDTDHLRELGEYPGGEEVRTQINFFKRKFKNLDQTSLENKRVENGFCQVAELAAKELLCELNNSMERDQTGEI